MFETPIPPEEEPVTSRDEAGEPSGEEDPANEEERIVDEPEDYLALAQRIQADFENYRKRAVREAAAAGERAKGGLVRELLPVVDNLERASPRPRKASSTSRRACASCTQS